MLRRLNTTSLYSWLSLCNCAKSDVQMCGYADVQMINKIK